MVKITFIFLFLAQLFLNYAYATTHESLFNTSKIQPLIKAINSGQYPKIHSVIIDDKNNILFEQYFNGQSADQLHDTRSAFKSISRAPYSLKNIRQRDLKFSQTRQIFLGLVILNQKNLTQYAGILDSPFGNL